MGLSPGFIRFKKVGDLLSEYIVFVLIEMEEILELKNPANKTF